MIFLPNKYERYAAALRNYIQNSISKKGLSDEKRLKFRKIYEFEAVFLNCECVPCDIKLLSSKLLFCAYLNLSEKGSTFDFSIEINGNYIINAKLYSVLLLNLSLISSEINIFNFNGKLAIKSRLNGKINSIFIKALNGNFYYELKTKTLLIIIEAARTQKKSAEIKREWDIFDPFSPINLYLF